MEYLAVSVIELVGVCLFPFMMNTLKEMYAEKTFHKDDLVNQRSEEIDIALTKWYTMSKNKQARLSDKMLDQIIEFNEHHSKKSFYFYIKYHGFFKNLTQQLQNKLISTVYKEFIRQFDIFFNDRDEDFYSSHDYVTRIVSNLQYNHYLRGENVISYREKQTDLFFIEKGCIVLYDGEKGIPFLNLPADSYFGDIPLMLKISSCFKYRVPNNHC